MAHFVYSVPNSGQPAYAAQTAYVAAAPQASYPPAPRAAHGYDGYQAHTQQYAYAAAARSQPPTATYEQPKAYYQPVQPAAPPQYTPTEYQQQANTQKVHPAPIAKPAYSTSTYAAAPRQAMNTKPANVQVTPSPISTSYVYPNVTTPVTQVYTSNAYVAPAPATTTYNSGYETALYTAATNYYQQQHKPSAGAGAASTWKSNSTPRGSYRGGGSGGRGSFSRGPPRNPQVHYCEVCKISCAGPLTYKEHLEGQKHKKKEAAANSTAKPASHARIPNQMRCELCDVICTGSDAYSAHIRGVKHKKVVKLHTTLGKPIPSSEPIKKVAADKKDTPAAAAATKKVVLGTPKINFVGGTQLKTLGVKTEEVKTEKSEPEAAAAADEPDEDDNEGNQPVGHEYIEEQHDGKGISFYCKLCECKFNDPNAKDMHMKGRRHRLSYKKKVDPTLVVDIKPNSNTRRLVDTRNRRLPRAPWKRQERMRLMDDFRMEEEMYWDNRRRMASDLEYYERQNDPSNNQRRTETPDDRHVVAKHTSIYPTEEELQVVQNIVSACEKALKLVSDFLSESNQPKEAPKDKKPSPLTAKDGDKETPTVAEVTNTRVLKGVMRVGVLAKGLLLHNNLSTHLVVLCAEKPTRTLLERLADNLPKQLAVVAEEKYEVRRCVEEAAIIVTNEGDTHSSCTITLTSPVMREGNVEAETSSKDAPDVLDRQKCLAALAALRHAKWFQARANGMQSCVMVIRIMRDLCQRVPTWAPLSQWALELLVEKCLSSAGVPILPGEALRRVFEAISSGVLLPGGPGILDPCEKEPADAAAKLSNQQREEITASAQHALRLIAFRQIHKVLGMEQLPVPQHGASRFNPRKRRLPNETGEKLDEEKKDKKDGLQAMDASNE